MSKGLTEQVRQLFKPQIPQWACEFTSRHVIVTGVDGKRNRIQGKSSSVMASGVLAPSLGDINIQDSDRLRILVRETLRGAAYKGSEIAVVIPDEAARITLMTTDSLPKGLEEQQTFLRWKLKKTVPFDVDTAQIAFRIVGTHVPSGYDLLVALSPRHIIEQYETLMESLDIHAGFIVPSTLAALNLVNPSAEDSLFVKIAPDCVTTTIFQNKRMVFYRRVAELSLYESVYPTILYYQDKLGGSVFKQMTVCAYDSNARAEIIDLQEKIGISAQPLQPRGVEDIYKPVLGAVHLSWANLI